MTAWLVRRPGPQVPRWAVLAGVLVLLALAGRVAYVAATPGFRALTPGTDSEAYDYLARRMSEGRSFGRVTYHHQLDTYRAPGYPYFLAGVYAAGKALGLDPRDFARYLQALISTLTVVLAGALAARLLGRRAGLGALGLGAVYLPLIVLGGALLSEVIFVPLLLGAVLCALERRGRGWRWACAAGVLAGLAALTRENAAFVIPVLAFLAWRGQPAGRRGLVAPALLVAASLLTIAPWTVRNWVQTHELIPVSTSAGPTLAGTYNDTSAANRFLWRPLHFNPQPEYRTLHARAAAMPQGLYERRMLAAVVGYLRRHPSALPLATFWNSVRMLDLQSFAQSRWSAKSEAQASAGVADAAVVVFWVCGVLAIAGAVRGLGRSRSRAVWLVPLILAVTTVTVTSGTPRQRAGLDPFVLCLAGFALGGAARRIGHRPPARTAT